MFISWFLILILILLMSIKNLSFFYILIINIIYIYIFFFININNIIFFIYLFIHTIHFLIIIFVAQTIWFLNSINSIIFIISIILIISINISIIFQLILHFLFLNPFPLPIKLKSAKQCISNQNWPHHKPWNWQQESYNSAEEQEEIHSWYFTSRSYCLSSKWSWCHYLERHYRINYESETSGLWCNSFPFLFRNPPLDWIAVCSVVDDLLICWCDVIEIWVDLVWRSDIVVVVKIGIWNGLIENCVELIWVWIWIE